LEQYRRFRLVGDSFATKSPQDFAAQIHKEPVAIQVCRILNDFRPLERIVESLWLASQNEDRLPYLCVALAQYCYSAGVRYSILQAIMGPMKPIGKLMAQVPLRLAESAVQDDFVVAMNATLAERVLRRVADRENDILSVAFKGLAGALAPHVNRKAVMRRSPEARLAGRLFDADKVVKTLLGSSAEDFYVCVQKLWEWNSRYWEQRALLKAESVRGCWAVTVETRVSVAITPADRKALMLCMVDLVICEVKKRSILKNTPVQGGEKGCLAADKRKWTQIRPSQAHCYQSAFIRVYRRPAMSRAFSSWLQVVTATLLPATETSQSRRKATGTDKRPARTLWRSGM
jgi:hypothetical protein